MKLLLWSFAIFSSTFGIARTTYFLSCEAVCTFVSYKYGPYRLSNLKLESFKIYDKSSGSYCGTVEKLNAWTRAYVFKMEEEILSAHRSSVLSYGSLLDCLKEFEIRDDRENLIGYIQGKYDTAALAEFLFFNDRHELFAQANVNRSNPHLTICSPDGRPFVRGSRTLWTSPLLFLSHESPECTYYWTIEQEDDSLDPRFLWPFVGFIGEVWWENLPFDILTQVGTQPP